MAKDQQTAADSARARQQKRTTKPRGLVTREKELAAVRRELSTIRSTGVATKAQRRGATAAVEQAVAALQRQRDAAKRAGRATK